MLGNQEKLIYHNPKENLDRGEEEPFHTIDLVIGDKIIGRAEMIYSSKPLPHYTIDYLYVEPEYQGAGRASRIMDQVEEFLKKKGKAGVLAEAIDPSSPASGMYGRRGWQEVPDSFGVFAFNLPKGASIDDLRGLSQRGAWLTEREGYKKNSE